MSRIYGGIHFQFDNVAGKTSGKKIADYISANFLLPNAQLPLVRFEAFVGGVPQLRIHGRVGATCFLEASSDLNHWTVVCTNTAASGGVIVNDAAGITNRMRFYRVVEPN